MRNINKDYLIVSMWVSFSQLWISGVLGALLSFGWSLRWAWPFHHQEAEHIALLTQLADQAIRWGGGIGIWLNLIVQLYWGEQGQTWSDVLVAATSAVGMYILLCVIWEEQHAATTTKKDD